MKKWIDKYYFEISTTNKQEVVITKLLENIRNSKSIKLSDNSNDRIKGESISSKWYIVPKSPDYHIEISTKKISVDESKIEVQIKGNSLVRYSKYLGILILLISLTIELTKSTNTSINNPITGYFFLAILILIFLAMNFLNRNNIKKGVDEFNKILHQSHIA